MAGSPVASPEPHRVALPADARPRLAACWAALDAGLRRAALIGARDAVPVPSIEDRRPWAAVDPASAAAIRAEAAADRREPWPRPTLSAYARYWRDGVRTAYEDPARELRRRTTAAVLAAALTARDDDVDEAADGLWLLCEQTSWCWAAHEGFAAVRGEVVPDPDRPFLDLGAAETVEILAWADLVLGPALDDRLPGLRRRLRREATLRVIEPFLTDRTWHWLGLDGHQHNWNPWITGHVLAAALFLVDDPAVQERTVDLAIDGLDRYLAAQPRDGGCDEGFAYWWNGPARLFEALHLLAVVTGGAFVPWDCPPLPELARYPHRVALGKGWYVNVGDGPARPGPDRPWHVLHRWGRLIGDRQVTAYAASERGPGTPAVTPSAGLGRALVGLHDDAWRAAADRTGVPVALPTTSWLPDVQLLVSRATGEPGRGLTLCAKGGHNDENHNHNDVGSYVVAVDGTPVLVDLGQPTYTAISFTDRRYEQWVTRSEWHNLPVINGCEQEPGASYRAEQVRVTSDPHGDVLRLDLAGAYPPAAGCRSWRRTLRLDRAAALVTVTDEWAVDDPGQVVLHHVVAGRPIRHADGVLVIRTLDGGTGTLSWDARIGPGVLQAREVDDPLLRDVWGGTVHRLAIAPPAGGAGSFTLTVAARGG